MDNTFTSISELLDRGKNTFVGFGYKQIKNSAEFVAKNHGCEWARKCPPTQEAAVMKIRIRDIVMSSIPKNYSNKDVVWQRFRQYALDYCNRCIL